MDALPSATVLGVRGRKRSAPARAPGAVCEPWKRLPERPSGRTPGGYFHGETPRVQILQRPLLSPTDRC